MYLIFLKCCDIMYEYLGVWLSWESACFACKRSGVRIPSSPPENERAIRKNCAFFFGLVTRGFEPLGLGASRRIPSSPPVGKPDSIKSSIVKSGFFYSCFFFKFTLHTRCNSQELCVLFWLSDEGIRTPRVRRKPSNPLISTSREARQH